MHYKFFFVALKNRIKFYIKSIKIYVSLNKTIVLCTLFFSRPNFYPSIQFLSSSITNKLTAFYALGIYLLKLIAFVFKHNVFLKLVRVEKKKTTNL